MSLETLSADDVEPNISDELRHAMLAVILAFASLDTALSAWLIHAYGMPLERGAMLVENMDIGNKLNRLKKLCAHYGDADNVKALAKFKKEFDDHRDVRNTIAHATCAGSLKTDPATAVFSPVRAGAGPGLLQIVMMPAADMRKCAAWATRAAEEVITTYEKSAGPMTRLGE